VEFITSFNAKRIATWQLRFFDRRCDIRIR